MDAAQREELDLIVRCKPDLIVMHIRQNTNFDAALLGRVFELAKERARALLAEPMPDTGDREADRIIGRLMSSDPDFVDCADAAVLIRSLVAARGQHGA
ncbi:hypothetical protein WK13_34600 [Burkholderia ubonensis]|uniref:hypothetical protein n=1 Tax=Burkholderia ubonensis TaxID=101571 RepID=UPI00075980DE|nr:hypothetical protein [Burkholderia ubonensis]KVR21670.1 hypothetical protein WK13_34600 [Burkholderia ubonensis]